MLLRKLYIALLATFLAWIAPQIQAAASPPKLTAYTEIFFPISYKDENTQKFTGHATNILRQVMDDAGFDYTIKLHSWARSYKSTLNSPGTLLYSVARTPGRESKFIWLQKITQLDYGLYTTQIEDTELSLEKAKTARIAVTRGGISHQTLLDNGFKNFIFIDDYSRISQLVTRERVSIIFASSFWYKYNKGNLSKPLYKLKNINLSVSDIDLYFVINKETEPDIVNKLKKSFKKILNGKAIDFNHTLTPEN